MASEAQEEHGGEELHFEIGKVIMYFVVLEFAIIWVNVNDRLRQKAYSQSFGGASHLKYFFLLVASIKIVWGKDHASSWSGAASIDRRAPIEVLRYSEEG
jgi:hypothetical protein